MSNDKLVSCINDFKRSLNGQTIKIHNNDYATVALRIGIFRRNLGTAAAISTSIIFHDDKNLQLLKIIPELYNKILYKKDSYESIDFATKTIFSDSKISNILKKLLLSITTRGFDITDKKYLYLLPFIDLINHSYKEQNLINNIEPP